MRGLESGVLGGPPHGSGPRGEVGVGVVVGGVQLIRGHGGHPSRPVRGSPLEGIDDVLVVPVETLQGALHIRDLTLGVGVIVALTEDVVVVALGLFTPLLLLC